MSEEVFIKDLTKDQFKDLLLSEDSILTEDGSLSRWVKGKWKDASDKMSSVVDEKLKYADRQKELFKKALEKAKYISDISDIKEFGNYYSDIVFETRNNVFNTKFNITSDLLTVLSACFKEYLRHKDEDAVKKVNEDGAHEYSLPKETVDEIISKLKTPEAKQLLTNESDVRAFYIHKDKKRHLYGCRLTNSEKFIRVVFTEEDKNIGDTQNGLFFVNGILDTYKKLDKSEGTLKDFIETSNDSLNSHKVTFDGEELRYPKEESKSALASDYLKNTMKGDEYYKLLKVIKNKLLKNFEDGIYRDRYKFNFTFDENILTVKCNFKAIKYNKADKEDSKYQTGAQKNVLGVIAQEVEKSNEDLEKGIGGYLPSFKVTWELKIKYLKNNDKSYLDIIKNMKAEIDKQRRALNLAFGDKLVPKDITVDTAKELREILNKFAEDPVGSINKIGDGELYVFMKNNKEVIDEFKQVRQEYDEDKDKIFQLVGRMSKGNTKGNEEDRRLLGLQRKYESAVKEMKEINSKITAYYKSLSNILVALPDEIEFYNKEVQDNETFPPEIKERIKEGLVKVLSKEDNVDSGLLKITDRKNDREFTFDNTLIYQDIETGKNYNYLLHLYVRKEEM